MWPFNRAKKKQLKEDLHYKNELIIDTPSLLSLKQRYSFSVVTFLFWVLWFYLWNPLVSLLAWMFGARIFYDNMIALGGWPGLIEKLTAYVLTLFAMGLVFFGWALYNNFRFYNKKRRGKMWKVNALNLSDYFKITPDDVLSCKSSKRFVVNFDGGGNITHFSNESMKKED